MKSSGHYAILFMIIFMQACTASRPAPQAAMTQVVNAEGQAAITQGSKLLARRQALQDAIRHAALQSGAIISSRTVLNNHSVLFDAFSMRTAASVNFSEIIDEWEEDSIYHVRASVTLSNRDDCQPQYRKRLVATGFPLVQPGQLSASESQDIASGIPREIMHLLMESHEFIGVNHTALSLYPQPHLAPNLVEHEPYTVSKTMQLAASEGGQFILSGVIRDLQIEPTDYVRGSGLLAMARSIARDVWGQRSIGIDIYVHDGFTGALLTQYRYTDDAVGDVWIPASYTVGSEGFRATTVGAKISHIIDRASADIRKTLSCYPFTARIIKIDGKTVFIDAGAQENVNIGDQLVVYTDASEELNVEGNRQYIGRDKQAVGVLTIRDIKPRYALGELEVPPYRLGVKVGDWVRSW